MTRRHGSTLTELVVAVGIMMVLAAVSVPIFLNQRQQAWRMSVKNDVAAASVVANSFMRQGSTGTSGGVAGAAYVTPAASAATCSPSACAVTFDNANGDTPTGNLDAQHMVTIAKGNSLKIEIADHKYTVTGTNGRISGWSYAFDSTTGAGTWKQNNTTNFKKASSSHPSDPSAPDPDDNCPVVLDGTKLIIGADGMTCKLSTAMVNSAVGEAHSDAGTRGKVTEIDLHGHVVIVDGDCLFYRMFSLTSIPYLLGQSVTSSVNGVSYSGMFHDDARLADADSISHWDTRNVTDMSWMFYGALSFNQPISNFITSKVTDMSGMFSESSFNQPVPFDTSKVTNMYDMFHDASSFNQSVSNFNTSKVTGMSSMFDGASSFNQPVSNFDTSNVTNMSYMFYNASSFNQSVSNFVTSKVTDMHGMFYTASSFNQPVSNFNTSNVTDMRAMFRGASSFNQPISNFVTSKVTNMSYMFYNATAFDQDLTGWNVTNVAGHDYFSPGSALTAAHLPHFTS